MVNKLTLSMIQTVSSACALPMLFDQGMSYGNCPGGQPLLQEPESRTLHSLLILHNGGLFRNIYTIQKLSDVLLLDMA